MRNKYKGTCYYCGKTVEVGDGHFERYKGGWRTIHANCVFKQREQKEKLRRIQNDERIGSKGTI
jgi:ribosomal protein L24E